MNKKQIKKLVLVSYSKNILDNTKAEKIANMLSRSDLKLYLHGLKQYEKRISLQVFLPFSQTQEQQKKIQELFPDKKIIYTQDKSLMAGIKIIQNDTIIEYNIQHTLDQIVHHIAD